MHFHELRLMSLICARSIITFDELQLMFTTKFNYPWKCLIFNKHQMICITNEKDQCLSIIKRLTACLAPSRQFDQFLSSHECQYHCVMPCTSVMLSTARIRLKIQINGLHDTIPTQHSWMWLATEGYAAYGVE